MADKNISQLTALAGETIDRTNDQIAMWDNSASTTKKVLAQDIVTTGEFGTSGDEGSRVNRIVTLSQSEYDAIASKDPETIYVIEDGYTVESSSIDLNPDPDLAAGTVRNVVALTQAQYDTINGDPATVYPNTLFVITDGKTKDSYVGQIDTLADGTYTIDIYPVTDREITKLYVAWDGTTAGTLDFQVNGSTIGTQVNLTGTSPSNEDLSPVASVTAGQAITLVAASVDTITNVRFVVEYQS